MRERFRLMTATLLLTSSAALGACGGGHDRSNTASTSGGEVGAGVPATPVAPARVDTAPRAHHSKLGGALVGAAVGHVLGGHAVAGAAAGAMVQHERNKH